MVNHILSMFQNLPETAPSLLLPCLTSLCLQLTASFILSCSLVTGHVIFLFTLGSPLNTEPADELRLVLRFDRLLNPDCSALQKLPNMLLAGAQQAIQKFLVVCLSSMKLKR